MPIPSFSRHNRPTSPLMASTISTPARLKVTRSTSPPTTSPSYSPTITSGGLQQKLNIVTRVAIEGKAKQGQDGAAIKMYLKISLPLEGITPGTTIPLFPEENVKILTSQVHPLDNTSVPYNFSSTVSPLLHNAARALNLPARSSETFNSVFNLSPPLNGFSVSSSRSSKPVNGSSSSTSENIAPIDEQYTGHILVSGYNISYVLPKKFPLRSKADGLTTNNEAEDSGPAYKRRRPSVGEKNTAQFMAAVDMWVPYISRPPRSPYLLSLPTPRCLHNNIKLRIFPPTTASASFASLSSIEEEGNSWDLTSDPHVTRSASTRLLRANSYTHFADDESSDSSTTGFSDGCGIQGTFPSAERIRIRWAKPLKIIEAGGDGGNGRRRVGVKDVKGEMACTIRGKRRDEERNGAEGVLMDVEYKGTCRGVWFPGVATLLGMDVGLETKGSDVSWVDGSPKEWTVGGGVGYTGYDVGAPPKQADPGSRTSSESNSPQILVSSSPLESVQPSRQSSTSSTASLLRAPLPGQNDTEYSFEGSTATLASSHIGTISSMSSLTPTSGYNSSSSSIRPPGAPITLHLNMNEIISPAKNIFMFSISGTVLITPRPLARPNDRNQGPSHLESEGNVELDPEPIILPRFTVLAADSESTSIMVRNAVDGPPATVEVYNSTGDIYKDAQARKTVLQKGGFTKCAEDGGRIAFKSIGSSHGSHRISQPPSRPRTPNGSTLPHISSNSSLGRMIYPSRPKRDGPLMIPSVVATVTLLVRDNDTLTGSYAVRMCLNAPADADSEWLEFGLAQPGSNSSTAKPGRPPSVVIASASVEGVPVKFEAGAMAKQEHRGVGVPFEELSGQEWVSWVRVHVGTVGGGAIVVDYIVNEGGDSSQKGKERAKDEVSLHILLPTFSIPVGRMDVNIDMASGTEISSLQSNFMHQPSTTGSNRLLHYCLEEFFYPHLSLTICPTSTLKRSLPPYLSLLTLLNWAMLVTGTILAYYLSSQLKQISHSLESYSILVGSGWNDMPKPVTITTIVYSTTGANRWISEVPTETIPISSIISTATAPTATQVRAPDLTPLPPPLAIETKDITTSLTPSTLMAEMYALLPIQHIVSFSWPIQDINFHVALEKVWQTMETVWKVFRKVYHYPLDPT